nr:Tn3 family transposase [Streptomyces bambusae]
MADRLKGAGADAEVEIVVPAGGGRARLSVDKLGAVGEPESLTWLKATTQAMLPRIVLPDLLFEVLSWTGFLDSFRHVSDRRIRMKGLLVSLVALLVSQSCNIGPAPVIDPNNKALTRSRLSYVDQNYVRADTVAAANAALIGAQSRIELARLWGGGLLASVGGLRFVVPVMSINTRPGRSSLTRCGPTACCGCSAARGTRPRWGRRSPCTGGSTRRCTCSSWSTRWTTPAGG